MLLAAHIADLTARSPADLRVVEHDTKGAGRDVGAAGKYFGDDLPSLTVGPSQGEDHQTGVNDSWPIFLAGKKLADLRDGAAGLSIHVGGE